MGFLKKQLLNVIEWTNDDNNDLMVYRFPVADKEIKNGAQLTVRESQVAIFVNEGEIADVFMPGRYKLETANLPILTKLKSWKYGFNSPFKAEVYFVNIRQFQGLRWGTSHPFPVRDADLGLVRIRAHGTFSLQVSDAKTFLKEVFGTAEKYSVKTIENYSKSIVVSAFCDFLSSQSVSILDLSSKYTEIGTGTAVQVNEKLTAMGLKVADVIVENVSTPDSVEKAMDQKTSMNVIGNLNTYTQYQAANAIEDAAKNPGGMAGAGTGLGVGVGFGQMMANSMNNAQTVDKIICPNCNASVTNGKFCPECGKPLVTKNVFCIKCGAKISESAKFCPECGTVQKVKNINCPKCNKELPIDTKFCPNCGEKL